MKDGERMTQTTPETKDKSKRKKKMKKGMEKNERSVCVFVSAYQGYLRCLEGFECVSVMAIFTSSDAQQIYEEQNKKKEKK